MTLIVIACIIAYMLVGVWTFGYIAANCAQEEIQKGYNRLPSFYYDEFPPWAGSIFWPIYLLFKILIGRYILMLLYHGESKGTKHTEQKYIRIAEMKRIQTETEEAIRHAEEEVERSLRGRSA